MSTNMYIYMNPGNEKRLIQHGDTFLKHYDIHKYWVPFFYKDR